MQGIEITRKSLLSGKDNTMTLPITEAQLAEFQSNGPRLIQQIFPDLSADQREFLQTGSTPEEWALMGGDGDDGDEDTSLDCDIDPEGEDTSLDCDIDPERGASPAAPQGWGVIES